MGKGKRSRKQMAPVEDDDFAGVEDVSSDGEDESYDEINLTDSKAASTGAATSKRPDRRRARDVSTIPLMEGEGKSLRVRGFNPKVRAAFLQILSRFGAGEYEWEEFVPRLKQKTKEEIHWYGERFFEHLLEETNDSLTFQDGVPKEGLRVPDVLVRIPQMTNILNKVKASSDGSVHFVDEVMARHPKLRGGRFWKQNHDLILLRAVLKHGYGRWQAIADDKDLGIQGVICQQLLIPAPETSQLQNSGVGISRAQFHFPETSQAHASTSGIPQIHGVNLGHVEAPENQAKGTNGGNDIGNDGAHGGTYIANQPQPFQDQSMQHYFKEVQRRIVEFIKKRVLLLEKGLNYEMAITFVPDDEEMYNMPNAETRQNVEDFNYPVPEKSYTQVTSQLPQAEAISSAEILAYSSDNNPDRLETARLYNEMNKVVTDNAQDLLETSISTVANKPLSMKLASNLAPLEVISHEINKIFSPEQQGAPSQYVPQVENLSSSNANLGAHNFAFGASANTGVGSPAMDTDATVGKAPTDLQM